MDKIYVVGHKNPDTDSICSSITYCNYKRLLGFDNCIPVRLGDINKETEFVLNYFDIPAPELLKTVRTQVSDIEYYDLNSIYPDMTIRQVWKTMINTKMKLLPVLEKPGSQKMAGIVSLGDITKFNMETSDESSLAKFNTSFTNIAEVLKAEVISGNEQLTDILKGEVEIYQGSHNLKEFHNIDLVIAGEGVRFEKISHVKCIVLADGYKPAEIPCNYKGILLSTSYSTFNIIRVISRAVPVSQIMNNKNIISFNQSDLIEDIREIMIKWRHRYFPIVDSNNNVLGTLSRRHLLDAKTKSVILVDHNEKTQSVDGLDQARILEIIDHHRVGDIQTNYPIYFRNEPVGCTGTIIGTMYLENNLLPDKKTAGLLLSAILSDTLLFKSPTCTETDKIMAQKLSAVAELDIKEYGKKLLQAGIHGVKKTPKELFYNDLKEFSFKKYRIAVGQFNTVETDQIEAIKGDLINFMKKIGKEKGYSITALMITDILNGGSEILYTGKASNVIKELFNSDSKETTGYLPGIISRKQQVIPPILSKLSYY